MTALAKILQAPAPRLTRGLKTDARSVNPRMLQWASRASLRGIFLAAEEAMMRLAAISIAAVTAAFITATALSAAAPVSPNPGSAVTSSHPLFTWQLPLNEEARAIQIATKPDMSTDGYFFTENRVDFDTLDDPQTSWSSDRPMTAGHYWWSVRTWYDNGGFGPDDYGPRWFAPVDFYVPLKLALVCSSKFRARVLSVGCAWDGNAETMNVAITISKGTKRLASGARVDSYHVEGTPESYGWTWRTPKSVKTGQRIGVTVGLVASQNGVSGQKEYRASLKVK